MGIRIGRDLADAMIGHLRAALPNEGCGLLAIEPGGDRAMRFYPGTNVDASPTRYTMAPEEVLAALRDMEANGWRLGAIVHSHPATDPAPSRTDLREAYYPDALLVIVGFAAPTPLVRGWRIRRGDGGVEAVEATVGIEDGTPTIDREPGMGGGPRPGAADAVERRALMDETTVADGPTENRALVDQLRAFPAEIARAIEGVPEEALRRPGSDGGWGVVEILCHLRDWEEIFRDRIRAILEEERPALPAYDDALWEIEHEYGAQKPQAALNAFTALRGETVGLLEPLGPEEWERAGVHSTHGPVTIRWIAEYLRGHDAAHLEQIREALG